MSHSPEYIRYLRSWKWHYLRKLRLLWAGHKCENCGSKHNLQCHHRTYERLYHERVADLQILCTDCHPLADEKRRYSKGFETYCRKRWGDTWPQVIRPDEAKAEFDKWLESKK